MSIGYVFALLVFIVCLSLYLCFSKDGFEPVEKIDEEMKQDQALAPITKEVYVKTTNEQSKPFFYYSVTDTESQSTGKLPEIISASTPYAPLDNILWESNHYLSNISASPKVGDITFRVNDYVTPRFYISDKTRRRNTRKLSVSETDKHVEHVYDDSFTKIV